MREKMSDWTKIIDVLRVFRIGIIRLLAPEVNGSISAVDMTPSNGVMNGQRERERARARYQK